MKRTNDYWYIHDCWQVLKHESRFDFIDHAREQVNNKFETKEQAEQALKVIKLILKHNIV